MKYIKNCQIHVIRTIQGYSIPLSGDLNILPLQPWTKPTKTQICDWYSLEILSEQRMFVYPLTSKLAYFYDKANTLQQGHSPSKKISLSCFLSFPIHSAESCNWCDRLEGATNSPLVFCSPRAHKYTQIKTLGYLNLVVFICCFVKIIFWNV